MKFVVLLLFSSKVTKEFLSVYSYLFTQSAFTEGPLCVRKVKVAQSCPTLCDPMDYTVHGNL